MRSTHRLPFLSTEGLVRWFSPHLRCLSPPSEGSVARSERARATDPRLPEVWEGQQQWEWTQGRGAVSAKKQGMEKRSAGHGRST